MAIKTLKDIKVLKNRNVLVRVDFDVPFNSNGQVADTTRIKACLPTIKYLLEKGAKVALLTKLGRPNNGIKTSTKVLSPLLAQLLNTKVSWLPNISFSPNLGNLILLENIGFYKEDAEGDVSFAKTLATPYDFYVNEAFAKCHRNEAGVSIIPKFLPSFAGFRLIKEIETLTALLKNPQRPFIAIIGGAKIETKIPVVESLANIANKVLIGGKLSLELNPKLLKLPNILNSQDWVEKKDIGPQTISLFKKELGKAKTIVWNGPMGMFENEKYAKGTREIARYISNLDAFKVVGGGDTIAAITKAGVLDKMDFVSTGGGAMLTFLSGKPMPGIIALDQNSL